jgi:hypothetical protein
MNWQGQVLDRRSWAGDGGEALRGLAGLRCGGLCRTQLARFRDQSLTAVDAWIPHLEGRGSSRDDSSATAR